MAKVLLLEFNEICPPLIDKWMDEGKLPSFAEFHRSSQVFTTFADASDPEHLEPWIQWYSIHTGLPHDEHKVFYLTDGPKADHPDIWHRLHGLGKSVMNCASMNARPLAGDRVFHLPDPWCSNEPAFPPEIEVFKAVMAKLIQENTKGVAVARGEMLPFLLFLTRHGLSAGTVRAILTQLGSERLSSADLKWRRVALADLLQFDLFRHYYRRMRPDFATFFINSTAHLQHAYWRHMEPAPFSLKPAESELETYGDAVLFGYQAMDSLLRRFSAVIAQDTTIILCSALSQQPFLKREAKGGQRFFRLRDIPRFLERLGIEPRLVEPLMTHQYLLRFANPAEAEQSLAAINRIRTPDAQVFGSHLSGNDVHIGCELYDEIEVGTEIYGIAGSNEAIPFFELFYPIDAVKSGRHHPEGVLWIRTGDHAIHHEPVSILDIAPTVYDLLAVRGMVGANVVHGHSLVPRFRCALDSEKRAA